MLGTRKLPGRPVILAGVAVVALLAWFAAEDARQAALLDARFQDARSRSSALVYRLQRLRDEGEPTEEFWRTARELREACKAADALSREKRRREESGPARLYYEVCRRAGW